MPTVTITLTDDEQEALRQLIHAALLHSGEGALDVAAHFKGKIVAARQLPSPERAPGSAQANETVAPAPRSANGAGSQVDRS